MRSLCIPTLALALIAAGSVSCTAQKPQPYDWPTFNVNAQRTGVLQQTTGITAANLSKLKLQQIKLDGTVDASAIYLHGVSVKGGTHDALFVTTTFGKTIAIDARNGALLWEYTPPGFKTWAGTRQITNATPAADPSRQAIYAASPDGQVQKLAVSDGHALWRTAVTRLPLREKIASPLTINQGHVIVVTAGYIGDRPPYQGHVAILDAGSGRLLHVWNSLCSDRQQLMDPKSCAASDSAIWGRAGAVLDPAGNIFVATGNGPWNGKNNWGDAVLQLSPDATRLLANYTPANTAELNKRDLDVGSTSPALLGNGYLAQGGKDGFIRLLQLKQIQGTAPHRGGALQRVPTPSHNMLFTAPVVWRHQGATWLIAADQNATEAWTFSQGKLTSRWRVQQGGTSPVIAGGLLYVYDPRGALRVFQPQTGKLLGSLPCGHGHWNSPIVAPGMIVLPVGNANDLDQSGVLNIWRLP